MNSKVLTNEYKEEIENIGTLYYGSPNEKTCDVISMTLKGKFKPTQESKNYEKNSIRARHMFIASGTEHLNSLSWLNNHYIFTADFTEKGISYGKPNHFVLPSTFSGMNDIAPKNASMNIVSFTAGRKSASSSSSDFAVIIAKMSIGMKNHRA